MIYFNFAYEIMITFIYYFVYDYPIYRRYRRFNTTWNYQTSAICHNDWLQSFISAYQIWNIWILNNCFAEIIINWQFSLSSTA